MENTRRNFLLAGSAITASAIPFKSTLAAGLTNCIDIMDDYNAPGDGSEDETSIFEDAINALDAVGGGIILARGFHKINLVILKNHITIVGVKTNLGESFRNDAPRLQPNDFNNNPTIQWGDGITNQVVGGGLRDCSVFGLHQNAKGIYINGLREGIFENVVTYGFTEIGLSITSNNFSTTHNHFSNCTIAGSNADGAIGLRVSYSSGSSYTTATYFTGGRIAGGNGTGGHVVVLDNVRLGMTDVYADVHHDQGFKFIGNSSIEANGLIIDSGNSEDVLVDVPNNNPITEFIYGRASIDGKVRFDDGTGTPIEIPLNGKRLGEQYNTLNNTPILMGRVYLTDTSTPDTAYTLENISSFNRSGSSHWWNAPSIHRFTTNGEQRLKITEHAIEASNPVQFKSYTISELPGAGSAASVRSIVWVTDGELGPAHAYSDGSHWKWMSNNMNVV